MNVPPDETSRFGIVLTDEDGRVTRFLEKPKDAPVHWPTWEFTFSTWRR